LVAPAHLAGAVAVVIDVLRATTTVVHALAAGCAAVRPVATVAEARALAATFSPGAALLAGEHDARPLPGFDLGNSPDDFTPERCRGRTVVLTTTNGTRALLHCDCAERVLLAAFLNCAAVCEQLAGEARPIHIVCAGSSGEVTLEDTLLAGALVEGLREKGEAILDDGALLASACFRVYGGAVEEALRRGVGGAHLVALGYDDDVRAAARVNRFALVPEVRREPLRVEAVGPARSHSS
jgi:2-phosphosulfolactate phosphatase